MGRVLSFLAFALFLTAASSANGQVRQADVLEEVNSARAVVTKDPKAAAQATRRLEEIIAELEPEQLLERYLLYGTIGLIARKNERYGASANAFLNAAEAIESVPGQTDRYAGSLEAAAHALGKDGQLDEALSTFAMALNIRQKHQLLSTPLAIQAASQHLWLSLRVARQESILAALNQISEAASGHTGKGDIQLAGAYVAMAGALVQLGLYGQMTQIADLASAMMSSIRLDYELGSADAGNKAGICNGIASNSSLLAEILSSAGEFYRAGLLLHDPAFESFCGSLVNEGNLHNTRLSQAMLSLAGGNALAAETRLIEARKLRSAHTKTEDAVWADSLLAATRTQLGFLGQAANDRARIETGTDLFHSHRQIEWMISGAYHAFLSDNDGLALEKLEKAESIAGTLRANDWYLHARIAYFRAYLLTDHGDFETAETVVREFRKLRARILAEAGVGAENSVTSPPVAQSVERMEVLYELLRSALTGDRENAESTLQRFKKFGAPTAPETTYFAQIAYLGACIVTKDLSACEFDIRSAFDLPVNVPYMRAEFVSGQNAYNLSGDRFRFGPLRKRMYERISSLLWTASKAARRKARKDSPDDPDWERLSAQIAGADLAFELAQLLAEGAANTAAVQVNARLAAGSGPLAALLRQRQELSAQVLRKANFLLEDGGDALPDEDLEQLAAIDKRIANEHPDYIVRYKLPSLGYYRLKPLLRDDEAVVLVNSLDKASDIFVVTNQTLNWRRLDVPLSTLSAKIAHLRSGLDPTGGTRAATPLTARYGRNDFDRNAAYDLHELLFEGMDELTEGKTLLVSANGPLSSLPFSVLVTSKPLGNGSALADMRDTAWLIEKNPILVIPTVASLGARRLKIGNTAVTSGFVGFGDPVFRTEERADETSVLANLVPLPGTREEINGLASLFEPEATEIFLGRNATETALRQAKLENRRILAFATHGLMAGEIGDGSEPGLALTVPKKPETARADDDGYLSASEASTLKINAEWLLLSACNTASAADNPDSGGYSGLAQAFLFAGAKSILVSHWPVSDDAAPHLTVDMIRWHEENPERSKAAALQHAMLSMIDDQENPALAHPSKWAPFVLFGATGQ